MANNIGPTTNFPNGFTSNVTIRGMPLLSMYTGNVFWVSSSSNTIGSKGTFRNPFSTVQTALGQCIANNGDVIVCKAGHVETISSATAFPLATAGVTIIGLGGGTSIPTFTLDTANTSTIPVSAANISVINCKFVANFLSIAACFTLSTAKWFTLQGCLFYETSNVLNFLNIVKSTGAANTVDGLTVANCAWYGLGTTSVNSFILVANTVDSMTVQLNDVVLSRTATAAILLTVTAGVLTNLDVGYNKCYSGQTASTGGCLINVGGTTSTGWYYNNYTQIGAAGGDTTVTTTVGLGAFNNYHSDATGASGFLIPAADS